MSNIKEINDFEFESINENEAEIIKKGLIEYCSIIDEDSASDQWLDNAGAIELIIENDASQPETLIEILDMLEPLKSVAVNNVNALFRVKKIDEALSFKKEDPFIVSLIDMLYEKRDDSFEIEDFLTEILDLCNLLSEQ
jgi:hypothetical protein